MPNGNGRSTRSPPRFVGELVEGNTVQMRLNGRRVAARVLAVIDDGPGTVTHLQHD